jgi:signal transduction histidine kinase
MEEPKNLQSFIKDEGGKFALPSIALPFRPAAAPAAPAKPAPSAPLPQGKLLYKLLGVFLGLAILPVLLAGTLLKRVGDNYVQKESRGVKLGIAQKVAGNVAASLTNVKNILEVVQKSNDLVAATPRRRTEILGKVMDAYPLFMRLEVVDLAGRTLSGVNFLDDPTLKRAIDAGAALRSVRSAQGNYIGPVSRSQDGYPRLTIGVPIERVTGRPVGVLLGVVNLVDLSSLVKELHIGKSGYVYIVDMQRKQLIAHPDFNDSSKAEELLKNRKTPEVAAAMLSPEDKEAGAFEFTDQQKHQFLNTYAAVLYPRPENRDSRLNWRVFVQQPTDEAYEASSQMQSQITRLLIGVLLLTLALAYYLSQVIVQRVLTLQAAMELVGEGRFDVPQVPASNDEFGALTQKFLWMAHSLKDKTLRLVSAQQELQRWNSQLERRVQERTRALQEAQEQLISQEKLAALGQMASVVGHELRNPLAVMNNSVYFIKTKLVTAAGEAGLDAKLDKHLHILESEIIKSNAIIRDVLDFARNRALNGSVQKVDDLVEKAIERIQLPAGVSLRKELGLNATEAVVDEDELRQVLVNLMENACQAMTSGGTLTVGTKSQGDGVEITISDTGCGIPQEYLNKIFAPFFTTKSRGTGLGLAVVKKIIERHHGTIEVKSVVGEGTAFFVRLPKIQPAAEPVSKPAA